MERIGQPRRILFGLGRNSILNHRNQKDLAMNGFRDRQEAARILAKRLERLRSQHPLVLGIPRGAMPMAEIVAKELGGELGAILVHKIPSPQNEEFALGSIGLSGKAYWNPDAFRYGFPMEVLEEARKREFEKLLARQKEFQISVAKVAGRTVVIVDDGIATGATAFAAVNELKDLGAKEIVLATAVISKEAASRLRPLVDELISLLEPKFFGAVGSFFQDFSQVDEDQVKKILRSNSDPSRKEAF